FFSRDWSSDVCSSDLSCCTASIEPSASTLPSCRTVTVRAIERTKSISCSTTTTECFPASDTSSSAVRSVSCGVMPATGSSTSNRERKNVEQEKNTEHG